MKINENIVLSMVAPHVVDNALTYDKFDELFAMLSRSEQYSVTDLLAAHHIELRDADDDLAQAYATEFTADSADQTLFDHSVFGGNDPTACSWLQMRRGFLSNEQLAKAAHAGNRDAWNALCSQNQKLVMKYAVRYTGMYGNNLSTEELISAGNEGLVKGIERFDGVALTVLNVKQTKGSGFSEADAGKIIVLVELQIENKSSEEISINSMFGFEAVCDDYSVDYSFTADMNTENSLSTTDLKPGRKLKGWKGYEVPQNWKEMIITFTPDVSLLGRGDPIEFVIYNNK